MLLVLPLLFGLIFIFSLVLSLPTYWLWNWLMPDLFHLPHITWLQAWGLLMLCSCLFKSNPTSSSTKKD